MDFHTILHFGTIQSICWTFRCLWNSLTEFFGYIFIKLKQLTHFYSGGKAFFQYFCEETNIHGFNHVANRNHLPFER